MQNKVTARTIPFRMMRFVGAPTRCFRCGDQISRGQFVTESKSYVEGTALSRVRRVVHLCEDCTAAGEYEQHLAREAYRVELLAELGR